MYKNKSEGAQPCPSSYSLYFVQGHRIFGDHQAFALFALFAPYLSHEPVALQKYM